MNKIFKPRTTVPTIIEPYWMHHEKGGSNKCMLISGNSVLSNCVGYAWGRWTELLGAQPTLSRGNAENWWGKNDGYLRGQTPKLGAVACWRKGAAGNESDGAGHVAIVEDILDSGVIITSNSNYLGSRFYMRTIKPPYNIGTAYTFQGFIYPPIDFVKTLPVVLKTTEQIAFEVVSGVWGTGADRKAKLIAAGYNYEEVQKMVNKILVLKNPKRSVDQIAREVIKGKWGNGKARKLALLKAGYDYLEVQARVNKLMR